MAYDGLPPTDHSLWLPHNRIGCYVILGEDQIGGYTFYEIQWTVTQRAWVPREHKLRSRRKDIVVVQVEEASTPSRPSQTVVHTTQSDVEVYPFPSLGGTSHLRLPIPNTLGPLRANTGYRIEGTYLDSNYQGYGSQDPVAGRARRRWGQIDLSRDRNFTEASGWVRSDQVNESGPTGGIALGWPPVPLHPGGRVSQVYFLGGNRWRRPDRWACPACGWARHGGSDCQRQCEVGNAPEVQNCLSGGRVVRRTEAAGVWRERWRRAMRVPRRGRG